MQRAKGDSRAKAGAGSGTRPPAKTRVRRSPEVARAELLDAAERLFAERGPDAVGLRDVAGEAGVSHGLITHYFKTYEGLVEQALVRRTTRVANAILARLQAQSEPSAIDLVQLLIGSVSDPIHLRLVAWSILTGRAQSADFLPGRERGLRPIADAIHDAAIREAEQRGSPRPSLDDVDYALLLALGATYGWGLGKVPFLAALGRKGTLRNDQEVTARLITMVRALLAPE
ncbi:MAG TPA: helix-turn-helix domain-containing protein [Polyangiales bacterium]|nr:helix-turn-helix domain-containing protein [Polyangiales bacterium]